MTMIPVIYDLDEDSEATTVHFYCCLGCRSQSHYKLPRGENYGECHSTSVLDGTQCETCGREVIPSN